MRKIALLSVLSALTFLMFGCATSEVTYPQPLALNNGSFEGKTLCIMAYGEPTDNYEQLSETYHRWWLPRFIYGSGEVTVLDHPYVNDDGQVFQDNTNEAFAEAIFNRLRGYSIFKRVVTVKDRAEADEFNYDYLLVFHINECYAKGLGANANFVEWSTIEGNVNVSVFVYDLKANQRISEQNIQSTATSTYAWATPDVREYLRRKLLKGTTFHNAVSQITF